MKIKAIPTEHDKTLLSNNELIFKFSFEDNFDTPKTVERYITFSNDENDEIIGGVFDLHDIDGHWLDSRDYYTELKIGIEAMKKANTIFHGNRISQKKATEFYNNLFLKHRKVV